MRRLASLVAFVLTSACAQPRLSQAPPTPEAGPNAAARLVDLRAELRDRPSGAALYALAFYAASLGRTDEAMGALRRLDEAGWDAPLVDADFRALATLPAYRTIAARIAAREPVVHLSVPGFVIPERGLDAEGIAYDADRATFYVGSTTTGRIVGVDTAGHVREVARTGLREVLGLKVGGKEHLLWAACNDDEHPAGEACVLAIDPVAGAVVRRACVAGPGHAMNDLVVAADGVVYVTDSASGAVLRLAPEATHLVPLVPAGALRGTNGIALAPDQRTLLVAHGRGIARVDAATGARREIAHEPSASFVGIDGMSLRDGALYAVANSYGRPRIVRIQLDAELTRATHVDVLETENPQWDEPTTGALGPDGFYYIADSQLGEKGAPRETLVLRVGY